MSMPDIVSSDYSSIIINELRENYGVKYKKEKKHKHLQVMLWLLVLFLYYILI